MKRNPATLVLATALLTASGTFAADGPKAAKETNAPVADKAQNARQSGSPLPGRTNEVLLTGSYIKQSIRRTGRITDGANAVIVIDRTVIERSGAQDLKQLLRQQGIGR